MSDNEKEEIENHVFESRVKDIIISEPVASEVYIGSKMTYDRLTFDGYKLYWHGSQSDVFKAFFGQTDLSARENVRDAGPTPQGL